jgi:hypothetical protein
MKQHKKWFWAILLALPLLTGVSGCKKFLDRKPLGTGISDDITQGGLEGQVFGLYGALRTDGMSGFPTLWFKSMRSDDAQKGSVPGDIADGGSIFNNFQYQKDFWLANGYWDDHYAFIALCNNVISDIDSLGLTDPASLTNRGEATFMRAWAYFDLVRDFGSVPKIDFKVTQTSQANVPKSPVAEIYALIDADLQFATDHLPLSWDPKYVGRLTKGTANTLIAKTQLYRQNWAAALAKAEEVINSGQYALLPNYADYFRESGENTSESIFEVQMYENANGSVRQGNNHNETQGVRGSGEWDLGWGFNVPTQDLVDFYEAGDTRKNATILFSGQSDDPANGGYGQTLPPSPPLAQPYWNKKVYTDPARRLATGDRFGYWLNVRLLRYADVLLMAAEAANELGGASNTTKALAYLEQVRARARKGNNAVLPPVTTTDQAELRAAIQRERRAEFGMEFERFYDLVRWGLADDELGPLGYEDRNRYYPIPQPAIDKSGGVLQQNPEY